MTIGEKIKSLRRKNDVTQEKLAAYLNISYQAVSKWETNSAMPDISLVVPLANFFGVSTDELFGLDGKQEENDIAQFNDRMRVLKNQGKIRETLDLCREITLKYPRNYSLLDDLASSLLMAAISEGFSDEERESAKNEGALLCKRIMDDCTDDEIRASARQSLVLFYDFLGDVNNAESTAAAAPTVFVSREVLLGQIFCDPAKNKIYKCNNTLTFAGLLTESIQAVTSYSDDEKLKAYQSCIAIWETVIDDGNYLFYHCRLSWLYLYCANVYAAKHDSENALNNLEKAMFHAKAYDDLPNETVKYTGTFVNESEFTPSATSKNHTNTDVENLQKNLENSVFDFLREDPAFQAFFHADIIEDKCK